MSKNLYYEESPPQEQPPTTEERVAALEDLVKAQASELERMRKLLMDLEPVRREQKEKQRVEKERLEKERLEKERLKHNTEELERLESRLKHFVKLRDSHWIKHYQQRIAPLKAHLECGSILPMALGTVWKDPPTYFQKDTP